MRLSSDQSVNNNSSLQSMIQTMKDVCKNDVVDSYHIIDVQCIQRSIKDMYCVYVYIYIDCFVYTYI